MKVLDCTKIKKADFTHLTSFVLVLIILYKQQKFLMKQNMPL